MERRGRAGKEEMVRVYPSMNLATVTSSLEWHTPAQQRECQACLSLRLKSPPEPSSCFHSDSLNTG